MPNTTFEASTSFSTENVSVTTPTSLSSTPIKQAQKHRTKLVKLGLALILSFSILTFTYAQQNENENLNEYADSQEDIVDTKLPTTYDIYDSKTRDFTSRCMRLAQYSGPKACEVFNECCSEDYVLSKLNGDRCQRADLANGCTPKGTGIQWSLCRAYNCTEEVTTTSTTTLVTPFSAGANTTTFSVLTSLIITSLLLIVAQLLH